MPALRCFMLSVATILVISGTTYAADLAPQIVEPAAPVVPLFTWTGFYIGGYAGAAFGTDKLHNPTPTSGAPDLSLSMSGFTAGGLAGYNYQLNAMVLGAEAEFGYDGLKGGEDFINPIRRPPLRHAENEGSYVGRLRVRAGYAIDNILLFAAGGVSFADAKITQTIPQIGITHSITKDPVGWNIGAGAEYGFNQNWVGRVEYIYDNFGKQKYGFASQSGQFADRGSSLGENTVRAAVEYKF